MAKGKLVEGLGIVFNKESEDLGGFREVIAPEAVGQDGKVIKDSDVWFLMNHQRDRMLARANQGAGSLQLTVTPEGVRYSFEAPQSPTGQELVSNIERGELGGSSFAFNVAPQGETWLKRKDDFLRTVTAFSYIYDVSAVFNPAYPQTSCSMREGKIERTESQEQRHNTRVPDTWKEGHERARISGTPGPAEHKHMNVIALLDLKEGDRVAGDELVLMVQQLEARGIKVPDRPHTLLSHKEAHEFRTAYYQKASDLKPEIKRAYRLSPEDQALWDKYITVKDGPKK